MLLKRPPNSAVCKCPFPSQQGLRGRKTLRITLTLTLMILMLMVLTRSGMEMWMGIAKT